MQKVTMFMMHSCPYCRAALAWMGELCKENKNYQSIPVEIIDENEHPDIAGKYDYYFVPTYYVGDRKVHEGAASKSKVDKVFNLALQSEETAAFK